MARNYQTKSNQGALPDSITATRFGAGEFNSIASELENAVTTSGQTLSPADGAGEISDQLAMALAIYGAGGATYHLDTGVVNAYVLTPVSPKESPNALFNGFSVVFEPGTVNTTASTVNVGGLGVKSITLQNGTALSGGEISGTCCLKYNLGDDRFELIFSSDSFLSASSYYEIDETQADQGATSTNSETLTIYDVATLVGTSKFATIHLSHNPASGNQTNYTFDTGLDLTSYPNLKILPDPGAQLDRNTGDEILTLYSPSNLLIGTDQIITLTDMIAFDQPGEFYPCQIGCVADGTTDDSTYFQYALDLVRDYGVWLNLDGKKYRIDSAVTLQRNTTDGPEQYVVNGNGAFLDFSNTGLTSGDLFTVGATSQANAHDTGNISLYDFEILGPESTNPASAVSPDTSVTGLKLSYCLFLYMNSINVKMCFTGCFTEFCFPVVSDMCVFQRNFVGLHLSFSSNEQIWNNTQCGESWWGFVILYTSNRIVDVTFNSPRVESGQVGFVLDPGAGVSGVDRIRNIKINDPYLAGLDYDFVRAGRAWDNTDPSVRGADRTDRIIGIEFYGGNWAVTGSAFSATQAALCLPVSNNVVRSIKGFIPIEDDQTNGIIGKITGGEIIFTGTTHSLASGVQWQHVKVLFDVDGNRMREEYDDGFINMYNTASVPTASVSDGSILYVDDIAGAGGRAGLHIRNEGTLNAIVASVIIKTDAGDPAAGSEGLMCINTFDNTLRIYAESTWRTIISW